MISLIILFIVPHTYGVNSQVLTTQVESLCMTDFVVVNMNSPEVNIRNYTLCYNRIPNYEINVHGYNIKSLCFVHPDYLIVNKSTLFLNRCGEWLQIIGPSENIVNCMVAGSADIGTADSTLAIERRTIGVYSLLYKRLTSGVDNTKNYLTQVTMFEVAFDLGIPPSFYVIYRNESSVTIQFTDHNRPPE
ncbi:hypothetical protein EIN_472910, partial [Entamoeba invadens IP1]